ncbi:uncharacterized protein LOC108681563 [Hyalella azteca]|uniref:Uncharacterized protein LOC108681563 n=1 Tax=Hyalella azteca TaxID=294128 RepID=A0A8B7PL00_HYAAZ|nr:uncharacterized protein LOC108681563 [Hyalella azteca]
MLRVAAVTLSLLATLISAEIYGGFLSSCPAGAGITDPYVMTQQFWNYYGANPVIGMKLIAYDGTLEDDKLSCVKLNLTFGFRNITLGLEGVRTGSGTPPPYEGKGASSSMDGFFQLGPSPPLAPFPSLVLGSPSTGKTSVYLAYVSATEIVIRTCRGVFLNTLHTLYMFSSQMDDLAALDSTCLLNTVKSLPNNGGFKLKSTNWTNCV